MVDVLLIQPPVQDYYFTFKRSIPYGAASMAAALTGHGFSVEILDGLAVNRSRPATRPREMAYLDRYYGRPDVSGFGLFHVYRHFGYSFEHLGRVVRDKAPFLVGVSALFTAYQDMAKKTVQVVKGWHPQCRVVVGGHHPTVFFRETLDWEGVDFVIRGEGETPLPLLVRALKAQDHPPGRSGNRLSPELEAQLKRVPGLAFRTKSGNIHASGPAWMADSADFPQPRSDLVRNTFYRRGQKGSAVVVAARGCPMGCTYCSVGATSSHGPFRRRPVDRVLAEIRQGIHRHQVGFIDFEDENLTLDRRWSLNLFSGIRKIKNGEELELRAMNGLYPPSLDGEMIRAMKQAGFNTLNLSLGSTSARQLKRFGRPDVRAAHDRALEQAGMHGLSAVTYLIAGAPDQEPDASLRDLLYLAGAETLVGLSIFYPAPGSVDYERCREKGLLPSHFSLMRSSALPVDHTTSRTASVTLLRLARILNFMKGLRAAGEDLPRPEPWPGGSMDMAMDRRRISLRLLSAFLHDARIPGVTPGGKVYMHDVDHRLCREFARGIARLEIKAPVTQ